MAESDYMQVAGFPTERLANAAVEDLLLKGLGAVVESGSQSVDSSSSDDLTGVEAGAARFRVMVVPTDLERASEVLGVVDPQRSSTELDRAKSKVPPLRYLVPAVLGALVGIPLLAFYLTYKLSGG